MIRKANKEIALILHDIRGAENVGSIFRTADAAGINEIFLTGYTPAPLDKFNRVQQKISKAALGAEKTVSWQKIENIQPLLKKLKNDNYQIVAIEQSKNSVDYKKVEIKQKTAFVFGNEVDGLPESVLKKCDTIAEIPMLGKKESLNVSVSVGVSLFRILNI